MVTTQSNSDVAVSYEQYGTGQPILLLHGGMAPPEYWQPVIPHLDSYAAIVPQRPGFGTCPDDLEKTSAADVLEREIKYVCELADAVDGTPILFGHSYGALTAIETAARTDVAAAIGYEPAILPEDYRTQANLADRMDALIEEGDRREAVKRYIEQVLHPDGVDDLDAWLAEWPVWPDCVDLAEEVVLMNRAVEQYYLPDRIDTNAPVLVLTGTSGPDFLRQSARDVHEALPQSRFIEFDGVSHSGPAEASEQVTAALKTFLQR